MQAKIEKMQEMFTEDLEELKNKQTGMNNALEGINSRITEPEKQINDLETEQWKPLPQNRMQKEQQEMKKA